MLSHRIIPALLLRNGGLVKTCKFQNPRYVGDPINAIHIFNEKEADELLVLDIMASKEQREPNYELIEQCAGECFMPLAYGGGVRTVEQAKRIFSLGVEKVCVQTASLENPRLISELSERFGSQSIMVSVDIKKNWFGRLSVFAASRGKLLSIPWLDALRSLVTAGAGEVLLNAVDKDGTLSGPDLGLIREASFAIDVPLVAAGGISSLTDIKEAVHAGASAVAAGAFFVFHGPHRAVLITYPSPSEISNLWAIE